MRTSFNLQYRYVIFTVHTQTHEYAKAIELNSTFNTNVTTYFKQGAYKLKNAFTIPGIRNIIALLNIITFTGRSET